MKAASAWPVAIVAVLGVTVIANIGLLWQANAPGSVDIEPNYYRRALAWDSTQAARGRSATLGWRSEASFITRPHSVGVHVALSDSLGGALSGAKVGVVGVHNLSPQRPEVWGLHETAPGVYDSDVLLPHGGRWELRISARRGRDEYLAVLHADAPVPPQP